MSAIGMQMAQRYEYSMCLTMQRYAHRRTGSRVTAVAQREQVAEARLDKRAGGRRHV